MTRRQEAESASLFGWVDPGAIAAPVAALPAVDPWSAPDELGTAPMFAGGVGQTPARHARQDCTWPAEDGSAVCGRRAAVAYASAQHGTLPRCSRHDTAAAQRRAAADGWIRRPLMEDHD